MIVNSLRSGGRRKFCLTWTNVILGDEGRLKSKAQSRLEAPNSSLRGARRRNKAFGSLENGASRMWMRETCFECCSVSRTGVPVS